MILKHLDKAMNFDRSSSETVYFEITLTPDSFLMSTPVVGPNSTKAITSILVNTFPWPNYEWHDNYEFKVYFCIGSVAQGADKAILEILIKDILINEHTNMLLTFLTGKVCGKKILDFVLREIIK